MANFCGIVGSPLLLVRAWRGIETLTLSLEQHLAGMCATQPGTPYGDSTTQSCMPPTSTCHSQFCASLDSTLVMRIWFTRAALERFGSLQ